MRSPLIFNILVNSEGFLAEVFHPWVRWKGPGSGFENSSGAGAGVWKSKWVGPSWAQAGPKWVGPSWAHVGGPKPGPSGWAQAGPKWVGPSWAHVGGPKLDPSGWAQAGPKWVGPGYTDLAPLGLRSKNKVFELSG